MNTRIENLTKQHCLEAFERIKTHPKRKDNKTSGCFYINPHIVPTRYRVEHGGDYYPPKEVLRVAYVLFKNSNSSDDVIEQRGSKDSRPGISGGEPTNKILEGFGFTVSGNSQTG